MRSVMFLEDPSLKKLLNLPVVYHILDDSRKFVLFLFLVLKNIYDLFDLIFFWMIFTYTYAVVLRKKLCYIYIQVRRMI